MRRISLQEQSNPMIQVTQDPLGGWCVVNCLDGKMATVLQGRISSYHAATRWLSDFRQGKVEASWS